MDQKKIAERVDINFESHPPIDDDLDGVATLLKQTFLQFADCQELARYLIRHQDYTQVIVQEAEDEENTSEEDEPDNDIYGVCSVIELPILKSENDSQSYQAREKLLTFITDKSAKLKSLIEEMKPKTCIKIGLIVNERYINLPPQLALPTLRTLTRNLDSAGYTHLLFISKILIKSRDSNTKLPSKKSKQGQGSSSDAEPLIFLNGEEEIICENAEFTSDYDVSSHCDENASWSFSSDIKYTPHRRIMLLNYSDWPKTLQALERELQQHKDK